MRQLAMFRKRYRKPGFGLARWVRLWLARLGVGMVLVLLLAGPGRALGPVVGPAKCEIAWTAPTTNTDGTPLTDLKSYNVYVAPTPGAFTAPVANLTVLNPAPGPNTTVTWDCRSVGWTDGQRYATVRAADLAGNEGANGAPDPTAGGTQAGGIPFVFDGVKPAPASGLKFSSP